MRKPTIPVESRRKAIIGAIAVCLLITPAIAACSNPIESAIEGVTGGNVDIGGTSVPDDFPAEVPLVDGEVVAGLGLGSGADKVWTVTLKVDGASALDAIKTELEAAGFTAQFDQGAGGVSGVAYQNTSYGVLVVVAEDGSNGWIATYNVAPVGR